MTPDFWSRVERYWRVKMEENAAVDALAALVKDTLRNLRAVVLTLALVVAACAVAAYVDSSRRAASQREINVQFAKAIQAQQDQLDILRKYAPKGK